MTTLSTHVLDSALGVPARAVAVCLDGGPAQPTDDDGRLRFQGELDGGTHTLTFATAAYFGDRPHFHPEVSVSFAVEAEPHCHVALLLGPYSYTTYKGS